MKKLIFIVLDILSAAFLIGGYVVHYFTKRKLGMVRWVNYYNIKYQQQMPLDVLKYIAVGILLIGAVLLGMKYMKKRKAMKITDAAAMLIMLVLTAIYLGVTVFASSDSMTAYYFIMPLAGMSALMMLIRNAIAVGTVSDEK